MGGRVALERGGRLFNSNVLNSLPHLLDVSTVAPMLTTETSLSTQPVRLHVGVATAWQTGTVHIHLPPCLAQRPRATALVVHPSAVSAQSSAFTCLRGAETACTRVYGARWMLTLRDHVLGFEITRTTAHI